MNVAIVTFTLARPLIAPFFPRRSLCTEGCVVGGTLRDIPFGCDPVVRQAIMVFSTGLAPAAMGLLIDGGISMEAIALTAAAWCVGASALAAFAGPPARLVAPGAARD